VRDEATALDVIR
jgi:hypothetical protein